MQTLADVPLRQVPVVEPQTTLDEVVRLLDEEPLRTVVLVGDGMYFGVFNDSALDANQSNLIPPDADLSTLMVGPYVHPARVIGSPQTTIAEARSLMDRRGVTVIPVVSNHIYKGVVTREDLE